MSSRNREWGMPRVYALLAVTVLIHGVNWPIMAVGLRSITPLWFASLRFAGGFLLAFALAAARHRLRLPPRQDWPVVLSVGLMGIACTASLLYLALRHVPAGRSSVLVWSAALWALPVAAVALRERMSPLRWASLAVGISGIVLLFEPWRFVWSDRAVLTGHILLLLVASLNAVVMVHQRGHRWRTRPFEVLPWQLLLASGALLVIAGVGEGLPRIDWSWSFGANLGFQIAATSGFLVWTQQMILQRMRVTSFTLIMMGVPVVGLTSSILTLGESVTLAGGIGVAAVIAGVAAAVTADARVSGNDSPRAQAPDLGSDANSGLPHHNAGPRRSAHRKERA